MSTETPPPAATSTRRRSMAKLLVALGTAAVVINGILLVTGDGANAPQLVNVVLGAVIAVFGLGALRSARS